MGRCRRYCPQMELHKCFWIFFSQPACTQVRKSKHRAGSVMSFESSIFRYQTLVLTTESTQHFKIKPWLVLNEKQRSLLSTSLKSFYGRCQGTTNNAWVVPCEYIIAKQTLKIDSQHQQQTNKKSLIIKSMQYLTIVSILLFTKILPI
jgi:hypothetical protein